MPASMTASVTPRSNSSSPLHAELRGAGEMRDWSIVTGVSTAAPTTYAGLSAVFTQTYYDCTSTLVRNAPGGTSISLDVSCPSWGPSNAGLNLWVMFFRGLTPSGSDEPVAVSGPFVIDGS